ncbi:D-alanyl-D-alanine carboxypeptidase [Paenibacillaceae bacterium]|nr:D-alanyl-D-alanine carboxypeptidase [Paenibacillaceae bacterium]
MLVLLAVFLMLPASYTSISAAAPKISTNAHASALIDVESGRLLHEENGDERNKIASLTKIMTAIVAIEHGDLADVVKVGKRAAGKEGSSIYLKVGEEMSLGHMLYGLMLRSGNDAATAIAEHVGGSEEGFVHMMNEKAEWLGLQNTHFMNPHGLDHEDHYSSANDMAQLTAYAMRNESFREIVKTRVKNVPNPNDEWDYRWTNKNKMLTMYEGADGVKTGYTKQAFRCLVSSATRDGQQLVAVTLNDGDDWLDHRNLLDFGFEHFPLQDVVQQGQQINGYPFMVERTFRYPFADGEGSQLTTKLVLTKEDSANFLLGERGRLELYVGQSKIGAVAVREDPEQAQAMAQHNPSLDQASQASYMPNATRGSFIASLKIVFTNLFFLNR